MPTVHLLIKGKVQGVFYRASAKEAANKAGVTGWVKNTPDGDVEAIASGSETAVQSFIEWCRKGPRMAKVTDVVVTPITDETYNGFAVIR